LTTWRGLDEAKWATFSIQRRRSREQQRCRFRSSSSLHGWPSRQAHRLPEQLNDPLDAVGHPPLAIDCLLVRPEARLPHLPD
jgi:hypothetical protein